MSPDDEGRPPSILSPAALTRLSRRRSSSGPVSMTGSPAELRAMTATGLRPVGVVGGSSVFHVGPPGERGGTNLELTACTQALHSARGFALARLVAQAEALGATGVLDVSFWARTYDWADELLEVATTGTAVAPGPGQPEGGDDGAHPDGGTVHGVAAAPWTTRLDASEVGALRRDGWAPASILLGTCVHHIEHRSLRRRWPDDGRLGELPTLTQGLADGREIALARLHAHGEQAAVDVVVAVEITQETGGWADQAVASLAIGDGLRHASGPGTVGG